MPEKTEETMASEPVATSPSTKKTPKAVADKVNDFTSPAVPRDSAYDAEGRLINQAAHEVEQAARNAILHPAVN